MVAPRKGQSPRPRVTNSIGASFGHQKKSVFHRLGKTQYTKQGKQASVHQEPPNTDLAPFSRDPAWKQAVV